MPRVLTLAAFLLVPVASSFAQEGGRDAAPAPLTFDAVYGDGRKPDFNGSVPRVLGWADDETYLLADGGLQAVDAATGTARPLMDRAAIAAALASQAGLDRATAEKVVGGRPATTPDGTAAVFEAGGDLYLARLDGNRAARLTATDAREELPSFSPDGKRLAFVRENDLYAVDLSTAAETRLTDGGTDLVRHGKADWVYFEELYDRSWRGYRWSPDGASIALMEYDDRGVGSFTVIDELPNPQRIERTHYPKAGTPNPDVRLGVVPADGSAPVRWYDLPVPEDGVISHFGWWPKAGDDDDAPADLFAHVQDRTQTRLDVLRVDPATGAVTKLLRDETAAWVSSPGDPHPLPDGTFLLASERDGWRHLYRFNPDGSLRGRVTAGDWEVRRVHAVTGETVADGWVYFTGTKDSHLAENLYRVRPDGSGLTRLTPEGGTHRPQVAPGGSYFIDTYSSVGVPRTVVLRRGDGEEIRTLGRATPTAAAEYRLGSFEWVTIPARDGWMMDGYLVKPPDFDPQKKYPVWVTTYGGPHAPTVKNAWSSSHNRWEHLLANAGIVTLRVDTKVSSGRGAESAWAAYRKFGVRGARDLADAADWLAEQPWCDAARIGLNGHSYGGYLTAYTLTHGDRFAAGIAGAPVTDFRNYDTIYTERYMGDPRENAAGYDLSSVVKAAGDLNGRLLILHGVMDDNVHVQNTLQLAGALQGADRDFELMLYPRSRHGIGGRHVRRLMYEFVRETMGVDRS